MDESIPQDQDNNMNNEWQGKIRRKGARQHRLMAPYSPIDKLARVMLGFMVGVNFYLGFEMGNNANLGFARRVF
jgi:hypothetical protein